MNPTTTKPQQLHTRLNCWNCLFVGEEFCRTHLGNNSVVQRFQFSCKFFCVLGVNVAWCVRNYIEKKKKLFDIKKKKKFGPFLDLCVSSLRRGHANLLCIVPILSDVPEGTTAASRRAFLNMEVVTCLDDVGLK